MKELGGPLCFIRGHLASVIQPTSVLQWDNYSSLQADRGVVVAEHSWTESNPLQVLHLCCLICDYISACRKQSRKIIIFVSILKGLSMNAGM